MVGRDALSLRVENRQSHFRGRCVYFVNSGTVRQALAGQLLQFLFVDAGPVVLLLERELLVGKSKADPLGPGEGESYV